MKRSLQTLALLLALVALGAWLVRGAHFGWTRTSIQVRTLDEITGLEQITWQDKFVPGLDFLGAGLAAAAGLVGVSFFFRHQQQPPKPN